MDTGLIIKNRRLARSVNVAGTVIGGDAPVSVQSMTNTKTSDGDATVSQILALEKAGCDIVRVAVPDVGAADEISHIKSRIHIPLVADIHFDYRLAIRSMEKGADKIRINPGNIGSIERVKSVVEAAASMGRVIRLGVNSGSLEKDILEKCDGVTAEGLCESALRNAELIDSMGFKDLVVSIKSSDVLMCTAAYRLFAQRSDLPLHLGITEAGTPMIGSVKSAIGLSLMLSEGIGDTVRVSLSGDPVEEVRVASLILATLGLKSPGVQIISCPTCGRTNIDLLSLVEEVTRACEGINKDIKVAVMGCGVNGPGEARSADIGIAGGDGVGLIFRQGQIIKKVEERELLRAFKEELKKL